MVENRFAAFVPEAFGPDILAKRLDAEHSTVLLTATVVSGLLEEPLEFVQAPALFWVEWTHQNEEQRRALNLLAQGLRERLTGDEYAIVEEDLNLGAWRAAFHVKSGREKVPYAPSAVSAPVADQWRLGLNLGVCVAHKYVVMEGLSDV